MDAQRVARAAEAITDGRAQIHPGEDAGTYTVTSFTTEETYTVDLRGRTCTCPDAAYRGETCKHLLAVALLRGFGG